MSNEVNALEFAEEGQSSVGIFELPTGYLDDEGKLHKKVSLHEMTGVEEDILASKKTKIDHKLNKIIANCIDSIGDISEKEEIKVIVRKLLLTDRLWLLVRIRILSLGELFSVQAMCPSCEKTSVQSVSLENFKVTGIPDPYKKSWNIKLPKSKKECTIKVMTGEDEVDSEKYSDQDTATAVLLSRIIKLNDSVPTLENLKKLPLADRQYIRKFMKDNDGNIDNMMEMTCPHCQHDFSYEVEIGSSDFFFPSAM